MLLLGRGACRFLGIGLMDGSSSILKINICIQKLKVRGDILSPCGLPRPSPKFLEERPLSKSIQAVLFLPIRESQPRNVGPKPKNFNTLSRKLWDKVSKALANGHVNCNYRAINIILLTVGDCFPDID